MNKANLVLKAPRTSVGKELRALSPLVKFRGLEVYQFRGQDLPATMYEIGKVRQQVFSKSGAGRGGEYDLDDLDFGKFAYTQLITFDPANEEIVATYRYQWGSYAREAGDSVLRTTSLFNYSNRFRRQILPHAIELGRSVVNDEAKRRRFGLFAMWKGIAALLRRYPQLRYFFGNVTLYKTMNPTARDVLISYMQTHYSPPQPMLQAKPHLQYNPERVDPGSAVSNHEPDTPENRIHTLRTRLLEYDEPIPPILQSYMALSTRIWLGETAKDEDFGNSLEIGLVVPVSDIQESFKSKFQ